ncbi:hypothetical protein [Lysobacter capsici]|uniref:hypothetical protein n=1 Tax=Lysobacter capsici TaxID=435897 RepID=UPI001C0064DB|nr:hypothetical protein [Lysobacter capsici]QWF17674.1 hypothetical protein KME82_02445 [Lysobacter capsici]
MAALTFTGSDGGEGSCGCFAAQAPNKPVAGNSIAIASQAGIRMLTIDVCLPVVTRLGASDSLSLEYASARALAKPWATRSPAASAATPRACDHDAATPRRHPIRQSSSLPQAADRAASPAAGDRAKVWIHLISRTTTRRPAIGTNLPASCADPAKLQK